MKSQLIISICLASILLLASQAYAGYIKFLVCPYELAEQMKTKHDLGDQREILFNADYEVLAVRRNNNKKIIPKQHFRPEHTFAFRLHPESVSWENSLHISTIIIVENPKDEMGVAIKKTNEQNWKVYWLKDTSEITKSSDVGILYLPKLNKLEAISEQGITN